MNEGFQKNSVLKIFIIFFEENCPGQWSMTSDNALITKQNPLRSGRLSVFISDQNLQIFTSLPPCRANKTLASMITLSKWHNRHIYFRPSTVRAPL